MNQPVRTALALTLAPFVALGLARFAYGLLLPPMRDDLGWSYGLAGGVTTANAVGYLAGALLAPTAMRRWGERMAVVGGVWVTAVLLGLNGVSGAYVVVLLTRLGAGLTGGIIFVAGGVLAARVSQQGAPDALTWYTGGAGAGIAVSALLIPALVEPVDRWPLGWYVMAGLTVLCGVVLTSIVSTTKDAVERSGAGGKAPAIKLPRAEVAYACFGLGYIGYVTFAVAYLRDGGASARAVTGFWFLLGMAGVAAIGFWPQILRRESGASGLAMTLAGCAVGVACLTISRSWPAAVLSAVLVGGCFLAVVSAVTGLARDQVPAVNLAATIARLTVVFGAGQTLGPVLAGTIGDTSAGLRLGLAGSAAVLLIGSLVSWSDREPHEELGVPASA